MIIKNKKEADKSRLNFNKNPLLLNNLYKLSVYILLQNRYKINDTIECWWLYGKKVYSIFTDTIKESHWY